MREEDFLIVGLGNPGGGYGLNRHNVGFLILDELAKRWNSGNWREKYQAEYTYTTVKGRKIHLVKPQTYMNKSGDSIRHFVRFFKIKPDQILVVHDDLDMAPARIKLVIGGGTGGHNGIKSIVASLGLKDFYRLKVGIGRPGQGQVHPDFPVEKYVLSDFAQDELQSVENRFDPLEQGIESFLAGDSQGAMGILNSLK